MIKVDQKLPFIDFLEEALKQCKLHAHVEAVADRLSGEKPKPMSHGTNLRVEGRTFLRIKSFDGEDRSQYLYAPYFGVRRDLFIKIIERILEEETSNAMSEALIAEHNQKRWS